MKAPRGSLRKRLRYQAVAWLVRVIRLLAALMPYPVGVRAGGVLGNTVYYLLPGVRKQVITHLSLVFQERGQPWIRRAARRNFVHLGKALLEVMLITPRNIGRKVHIRGEENLRNALAQGKGVVFVTGHIGNWELMAQAVAASKAVSVVAAPLKSRDVNDILVALRARMGVRTILRGRPGASRELIRVFRENRLLGILIDQDTDVEGAFVDFMGRPAWTPTAAASMAIKFGAPVLFGFIQRETDDRHTVTIEGPLDLIRTGNDEKDIVANTAMLTKKIENCIMHNPEQWVWMHRRWRRQP